MSNELFAQTAADAAALLERGEASSTELTQAAIDRVKAVDGKVKAFLSFDEADALAQAKAADDRRAKGESLGPLDGIPVAVKDVISIKGQPLTCASKMLEKFVSPYDAGSIERLKKTGAVLWGRLNMDEFAMGSSCENSAFQKTANPWDLERIPGGSSGGSAACLAAGETILSLGTDTGGSIRQPAALCNVVGLKPTYGLVSRYGLVAFASSLDQIGPLGRSVADVATLLQGIVGHDPKDSTSVNVDIPDYRAALNEKTGPWKIGVPGEYFGEGLHPDVRRRVEEAIHFYTQQGCEIVDISLPHAVDLAIPTYYIIATAEASSNLARYDGVRYTHRSEQISDAIDLYSRSRGEGFGEEVKRRIILGTFVLSSGYYDAWYLRAQKVRTLIRNEFAEALKKVDFILSPTTPEPAFKIGEKSNDPLSMYLEDLYTISVNLAGLPGISVPCGFTPEKLPVGFQLIGRPFAEAQLLQAAHAYEREHPFAREVAEL